MDQYLLLLYSDDKSFRALSPQEMQEVIGRYRAWGKALRDSGKLLGSNKLEDGTGRVLRGADQLSITDGPFTESKEVVGGYYLVQAASFEAAVDLCRDCPHLRFGVIEVRRIQVMA